MQGNIHLFCFVVVRCFCVCDWEHCCINLHYRCHLYKLLNLIIAQRPSICIYFLRKLTMQNCDINCNEQWMFTMDVVLYCYTCLCILSWAMKKYFSIRKKLCTSTAITLLKLWDCGAECCWPWLCWTELYLWIKRVLQKAVDKHVDRAASSCWAACECAALSICDKGISTKSPGGSYSD